MHDILQKGMRVFSKKGVVVLVLIAGIGYLGTQYIIKPMLEQKNRTQVIATQHQDFVVATGSVEAKNDTTLAFEEGGVVQKIHYTAGDTVKKGAIIASLNSATLQADVEAQRSRLEQESIRLNSFVGGPEENERTRVNANIAVSEQSLENEIRVGLVSTQQTAGDIEDMIRTKVDTLFDGTPNNTKFVGNIDITDKQKINAVRAEFESIFSQWRVWSNSDVSGYRRVTAIMQEFEKSLRQIHRGVVEMYDILLPLRSFEEKNEEAFILMASIRGTILDAIVKTTKQINEISVEQAKYRLVLAQSGESLAGSTEADRLVQSARVDTEKERLRRLELQLAKTQIRAPFDGVIGEIFVSVGEFASPGSSAARFISSGGFDLAVDVTEIDIQNIKPDKEMRAEVEVTGEELPVRVRTIDTTEKRINDVPVYTVVFDIISEKEIALRPGMTVDVYIPSGETADAFIVPRNAVIRDGAGNKVLIERGGDTMFVPVTIGAPTDDDAVIVTGELTIDDVVIFDTQ